MLQNKRIREIFESNGFGFLQKGEGRQLERVALGLCGIRHGNENASE